MFISPSHLNLKYTLIMANTTTKTIRSKSLADFYTPSLSSPVSSLSNSDFMSWLNQNYGNLPDDYKNQIINAYSNYEGQVFTPDIWQGFGEALGNYSARQKFENSKFNNLNTAISEILNAYHKEVYESEPEQVNRRNAAGINSDLTGGSDISSGPAGDIALPENLGPADSSGSSGVQELGSTILSLATTCMSFCQGIQSLKAGEIALATNEMSARKDAYNLINETIVQSISPQLAKELIGGQTSNPDSYFAVSNIVSDALDRLVNDKSLSPRNRRTLKSLIHGNPHGTLVSQDYIMKQLKSYYGNYTDLGKTVSDPFFSEDFSEMTQLLGEYYQKYVLDYEKLLKDFDFDKFSVVSEDGKSQGTLAGEANVYGLQFEAFQKENDKLQEQMWNNIMDALEEKHKSWANVLIMLVPIFRSMLMSTRMPSLHLQSAFGGHQNTTDVFMHKE